MKKILSMLIVCVAVCGLTACSKGPDQSTAATSVQKAQKFYMDLKLTEEQRQKTREIRESQRAQMENIRKTMEEKRKELQLVQDNVKIDAKTRKAKYDQYRNDMEDLRQQMENLRKEYDSKFEAILDGKQRRAYRDYRKDQEKEIEEMKKEAMAQRAPKKEGFFDKLFNK